MMSIAPRFAHQDRDGCWGVEGHPSCRCPQCEVKSGRCNAGEGLGLPFVLLKVSSHRIEYEYGYVYEYG